MTDHFCIATLVPHVLEHNYFDIGVRCITSSVVVLLQKMVWVKKSSWTNNAWKYSPAGPFMVNYKWSSQTEFDN